MAGRSTIRLHFTFQVLEAVRKAVGPEFIVGCRLVADEDWEKGLSREEKVSKSAGG